MRKEPKLMSLCKVLNSLRSSYQIVEVHDRNAIFHFTYVHASNLEIRLIHEDGSNMTNLINFRRKPGFNKNNPTLMQMALHCLQRLVQPRDGFDIPNRTEQTHDDIELMPKCEVDHVRTIKDG